MPRLDGLTLQTEPLPPEKQPARPPLPPPNFGKPAAEADHVLDQKVPTPEKRLPTRPAPKADAESKESDDKPAAKAETKSPQELARDANALLLEKVMAIGRPPKHDKEKEVDTAPEEEAKSGDDDKETKKETKGDKSKRGPGRPKKTTPVADLYRTEEAEKPEGKEDEDEEPETSKKPAARKITREDIARVAADAATRALRDSTPKPPPAAAEVQVPASLREEAAKYHAVGLIYKDAYAGRDLVKEIVEFNTAAEKFEKEWKASHQGEEFSWEEEDASAWMDANSPDVDPDHLETAEEELKTARIQKRVSDAVEAKYKPIVEKERQREELERRGPEIYNAKAAAVGRIIKTLAPDIGDEARLGELLADPSKLAEEIEKDPIAAEVARVFVQEATSVLDIAARIHFGIEPLNENSPQQRQLESYLANLESEIESLPAEARPVLPDGRTFVTSSRYAKLGDKTDAYSVFDWTALQHIVAIRSSNLARAAKEREEERIQKVATARGWVEKNGAASEATKKTAKAAFAPAPSVSAAATPGKPGPVKGDILPSGIPRSLAERLIPRFR